MIEVILNDRLGKKIRVKCNEDDTVGDLKKLVAAQTGLLLYAAQQPCRMVEHAWTTWQSSSQPYVSQC
jgi:hypothetical protein